MSISNDTAALQQHLDELAQAQDEVLITRYSMQRPSRPPGFYWQLRWLAGRILRWLESQGILRSEPWPVSLSHAGKSGNAKPLLIWAVGVDKSALREACDGFARLCDDLPQYAPVLVTDVADFAFFSRLGWLVEYVPRLAGDGEPFETRKARYLARLYRGAPAVPVDLGLAPPPKLDELRRWLLQSP